MAGGRWGRGPGAAVGATGAIAGVGWLMGGATSGGGFGDMVAGVGGVPTGTGGGPAGEAPATGEDAAGAGGAVVAVPGDTMPTVRFVRTPASGTTSGAAPGAWQAAMPRVVRQAKITVR